MPEVAIVTDSMACLTREMVDRYGIELVPIRLLIQGKEYRDSIDITPSEAYQFLQADPESFNTSPSSPLHYLEAYRRASARAKNILCITLSSGLSTACNMARIAREQALNELPDVTIEVIDSLSVTASEGFIVLAAARAAEEGKDLTQIIQEANKVKNGATFVMFLETIKHVYRTGRIPKVASQVGSLLNIKPILTISGGTVHLKTLVRNREQGIERILRELREKAGQKPVHVAVMHAYAPEDAEKLKERIAAEFNCTELWVTELTPVMGYATGTGTLGFAYYYEE